MVDKLHSQIYARRDWIELLNAHSFYSMQSHEQISFEIYHLRTLIIYKRCTKSRRPPSMFSSWLRSPAKSRGCSFRTETVHQNLQKYLFFLCKQTTTVCAWHRRSSLRRRQTKRTSRTLARHFDLRARAHNNHKNTQNMWISYYLYPKSYFVLNCGFGEYLSRMFTFRDQK